MEKDRLLSLAKTLRQLERHLRLAINNENKPVISLTISAIETQTREMRAVLRY